MVRKVWAALRAVVSILITSFLIVATVLAVATVVIPRAKGGQSYTVLTQSMTPGIQPGDMVALEKVDPKLIRVGDRVTFMPNPNDPSLITHRVVSAYSTNGKMMFRTKGDANDSEDDPIEAQQIVGRVMYVVPKVGWISNSAGKYRPHIVGGFAAALILYALWNLVAPTGGARHDSEEEGGAFDDRQAEGYGS